MIKRTWNETREYFNEDSALIKSQHGHREFRLFGILISRRNIDFNATTVKEGKVSVGFNNK